jgi:hypothetical protein
MGLRSNAVLIIRKQSIEMQIKCFEQGKRKRFHSYVSVEALKLVETVQS